MEVRRTNENIKYGASLRPAGLVLYLSVSKTYSIEVFRGRSSPDHTLAVRYPHVVELLNFTCI
jgi:hypothetical protein